MLDDSEGVVVHRLNTKTPLKAEHEFPIRGAYRRRLAMTRQKTPYRPCSLLIATVNRGYCEYKNGLQFIVDGDIRFHDFFPS